MDISSACMPAPSFGYELLIERRSISNLFRAIEAVNVLEPFMICGIYIH